MHGKVVPNEGYKVAYIFFISLATVATFVSLGYRLRIGRLLEGELHGISVKYNHHENAVKKAGPPSPLPDSSGDRAQNYHRQASQNLGPQKLGSQKLGSQKLGSQNLRLTNKAGVVRSSLKKQASVEASGLVDFRKQAQKYEWELLQSSRTLTICALTLLTIAVQELPFTVLNCMGLPSSNTARGLCMVPCCGAGLVVFESGKRDRMVMGSLLVSVLLLGASARPYAVCNHPKIRLDHSHRFQVEHDPRGRGDSPTSPRADGFPGVVATPSRRGAH
jgi:hypothetical protein